MENEINMFSINNLRTMEVIDIDSGRKLGYIKDFEVDTDECKISSIILPSERTSWFGKNDNIQIPWENIKKIGMDVVLIQK
ncbi:MAG: YlmC/YmxH family sporulation protein [Solirubrobacterales bacterium]